MYDVDYLQEEELQHHGILGQKWGIRRFQNKDGTRTPAGKKREQEDYDESSGSSNSSGGGSGSKGISVDKETLVKGAAIAGAVALGAVLITNPGARNVLGNYGKTVVSNLTDKEKAKALGAKIGPGIGKRAAKTANKLGAAMDRASDAMLDAALVSAGAIAISKVTDKLAVGEDATEAEKNRSKVMTDVATAGIKAVTNANGGNNNSKSGNKGGNVGKEVTDKLGAPSKKGVDKQSSEWQDLFKDQSPETRGTIKALAAQGYDIDQLKQYKKEFGHADFEEWASQYMGVEIGW